MNPFLVYSAADAKLDVVKIQEKSVYLLLYENILSDESRKKYGTFSETLWCYTDS